MWEILPIMSSRREMMKRKNLHEEASQLFESETLCSVRVAVKSPLSRGNVRAGDGDKDTTRGDGTSELDVQLAAHTCNTDTNLATPQQHLCVFGPQDDLCLDVGSQRRKVASE